MEGLGLKILGYHVLKSLLLELGGQGKNPRQYKHDARPAHP